MSMTTDPRILALSTPVANEASLHAARSILGRPDPATEMDRIYRPLLRHRTLLTAVAHLEDAGADLERLTVSAELFKGSWPLNSLFPTPAESSGERISLASIRSSLDTHRIVLQNLTADVTELEEGTVFLFGRAFDVAYPSYRHRMDYDVDVFVSDMDTGLRLMTRLRTKLSFMLGGCKVCRLGGQWLARFGMDSSSEQKHLLHIDLIVGGWPVGPGTLLPPWSLSPVAQRARQVQWGRRRVRVPAAEDMLLTLGAKIGRHLASPLVVPSGGLIRKDFNDALILLTAEQGTLDWDYISDSVAALNCGGVLHHLIHDAEVHSGRTLAPAECMARLEPGALERHFLQVAGRATEEELAPQGAASVFFRKMVLGLWPGFSLLQYVRTARRGFASLAMVLADRWMELFSRVERRLSRSTRLPRKLTIPLLRRLRRGFGSVCELGPAPHPPEQALCLSHTARAADPMSLDSDAARVLSAIHLLLPGRAELARIRSTVGTHLDWKFFHHCERVLFNVGSASPGLQKRP